jgi:acyl-CoA synthetase (NDP forming)
MKTHEEIKRFLNPKTIAIVGASNNPNKVGGILINKLKDFKGKIIPINLKEKKVGKLKAYSSIKKYKKDIDLVIIATPAKTTPKILKQCAKKKIKNAIIISSGFAEEKNTKLTKKLEKIIQKKNLNILGPNCFGIFNSSINLDATFSKTTPKKGNVAFISQSGALWSYIADLNKIDFSGFVSLGNMMDLEFCDFLEYYIKDKKTKKIICYIEKLKDGKKFIELCKNSKKEIIVVKSGRTEKGKKVAISHTASIATDFEIYKTAFRQAKVKIKNSLAEALDLKKENFEKFLTQKELTIITNAGGAGALLTDELTEKGFHINKIIDVLGTAKAENYKRILKKIKIGEQIILIVTPQSMTPINEIAKIIISSVHRGHIIAFFLGEKSMKESVEKLKQKNIPVFTRGI